MTQTFAQEFHSSVSRHVTHHIKISSPVETGSCPSSVWLPHFRERSSCTDVCSSELSSGVSSRNRGQDEASTLQMKKRRLRVVQCLIHICRADVLLAQNENPGALTQVQGLLCHILHHLYISPVIAWQSPSWLIGV